MVPKLKVFRWNYYDEDAQMEARFEAWLSELSAKNSVVIRKIEFSMGSRTSNALLVFYEVNPQPFGSGFDKGSVTFERHL